MANHFSGHWDLQGGGPPVLCISGFASANWMFHPLIAPLCNQFQFILPDNRGMGRSPPATQPYGLQDLASDLLNLMDDLGHEQFDVIGLSMGGFVAQWLAISHPARVKRMVLLCTTSSGAAFKPLFPMLRRDQIATLYQMDAITRTQAALSPQLLPLLTSRYPTVHEMVFQERLKHPEDLQQILLQYDAVRQFMEIPLPLASIACPTLILSGDQDLVVPLANGRLLANLIPGALLRIIPETDHLFFLEKADDTARFIHDFLT